jgi:hypothetical protein
MKKVALAFVFTLVLGAVALAHGDKKHVMGTVEKINPDSLVIQQKNGTSVMVKLSSLTVFFEHTRGADKAAPDKPAQASDLAVGDLVVIHATPKEGGLEANEVKFSRPSSSKTAGSAAHTAHQ